MAEVKSITVEIEEGTLVHLHPERDGVDAWRMVPRDKKRRGTRRVPARVYRQIPREPSE